MNEVKILQRAKLCLEKNKWTKHTDAKKANGHTLCSAIDKDAKCFCARGAVRRVMNKEMSKFTNDEMDTYNEVMWTLDAVSPGGSIVNYNDIFASSKKDVLTIFDKAIKDAKRGI